ncbi:hypothetical protein [Lishizhenia sp.]|uniref:hypothetical protein n=1 Tax=Lishizhenia sp. TaxID=2497594 RepID=UPI00299F0E91|nr:hypothetical protein [Lishizhenia sp.]MDX1444782.1 hypothetical protein [Lishizhenia sp.]
MKYFLFALLLLFCSESYGQKKLKQSTIHLTIENTLFPNGKIDSAPSINMEKSGNSIKLVYGLGLSRNISKSIAVEVNASTGKINNSNFSTEFIQTLDGVKYTYKDAHFITGNFYRLDLSLKKYSRKASLGFYFHFGVAYSLLNNRISRSTSITSFYSSSKSTFGSDHLKNKMLNLSFGIGKSKVISNRFFVDYGLTIHAFYFPLPTTAFKTEYLLDFINFNQISPGYSEENLRHLNKLSFAKEWFKVYVKIGLQNLNI